MKTKRKKMNKKTTYNIPLDETSSFNKYFVCNYCNKKYKIKAALVKHVWFCNGDNRFQTLTCEWCKLKFENKGNLIRHYNIHGDTSLRVPNHLKRHQCAACCRLFTEGFQLKCHQRREHYNLKCRRIPVYEAKNINDIWLETVLNSTKLLKIKMVGASTFLMTSVFATEDMKVETPFNAVEDIEEQYPIGKQKILVPCKICGKQYVKRNLKKHIQENHYNIRKYKCSNCNVSFKRSYQFLRHVCSKARKRGVKGVKQGEDANFKISSIESLAKPV